MEDLTDRDKEIIGFISTLIGSMARTVEYISERMKAGEEKK